MFLLRGRCERHYRERNRKNKMDKGFCEGCPWAEVCGRDDIDYPCHGEWSDVGYIDYDNNINMDEED